MKKLSMLGIDLAKNTVQVCGVDANGAPQFNKKITREKLLEFVLNLPHAGELVVCMEACGGSHHWGRQFEGHGLKVRLISPQFVKPFVKSNKNDRNDAQAITEAAARPTMRFVSLKNEHQQEILMLHNLRERFVTSRTALGNQLRGMLFEFGVTIPQGHHHLKKVMGQILSGEDAQFSARFRMLVQDLYGEYLRTFEAIDKYEGMLEDIYKKDATCQRIGKVEGVGVITATAIVASVGDATVFKSGREFAAWLGLVPRQHSTGGKDRLMGISKRGDKYLRKNLINGGRSLVKWANKKEATTKRQVWLKNKLDTRGANKAAVALANKNARIIWALMTRGTEYKAA